MRSGFMINITEPNNSYNLTLTISVKKQEIYIQVAKLIYIPCNNKS